MLHAHFNYINSKNKNITSCKKLEKIEITPSPQKRGQELHTSKQASRVNVNCVSTTWENRTPYTLHWDWLK